MTREEVDKVWERDEHGREWFKSAAGDTMSRVHWELICHGVSPLRARELIQFIIGEMRGEYGE